MRACVCVCWGGGGGGGGGGGYSINGNTQIPVAHSCYLAPHLDKLPRQINRLDKSPGLIGHCKWTSVASELSSIC